MEARTNNHLRGSSRSIRYLRVSHSIFTNPTLSERSEPQRSRKCREGVTACAVGEVPSRSRRTSALPRHSRRYHCERAHYADADHLRVFREPTDGEAGRQCAEQRDGLRRVLGSGRRVSTLAAVSL